MKYIVIHYSEIGTKGKNRSSFEKKLKENIKKKIQVKKIISDYGQFILEADFTFETRDKLQKIPGIANFLVAEKTILELDSIQHTAESMLKGQSLSSFKIETARHNKQFPFTSLEVNQKVGKYLLSQFPEKKVQLENPDIILWIEICNKHAFVGIEKYSGVGGLPVGTAGKAIVLVSGGIDSAVAAYLMMRRGCETVIVHFKNDTLNQGGVQEKIQKIGCVLQKFQNSTKIYVVPFSDLQREIIEKVSSEMRMLIYRYFMFAIAEKIAEMENALGIVTGDNLSQVASQTLENLHALYSSVNSPIFAPLLGSTKAEIIQIAKKVGTYEISILPYGDCCSFMIADHPELRATKGKIQESLKQINTGELIEKALTKISIFNNEG